MAKKITIDMSKKKTTKKKNSDRLEKQQLHAFGLGAVAYGAGTVLGNTTGVITIQNLKTAGKVGRKISEKDYGDGRTTIYFLDTASLDTFIGRLQAMRKQLTKAEKLFSVNVRPKKKSRSKR